MKKDVFDNYQLVNILKIFKYDPYDSIKRFEEYIKNYPNDYLGYSYYGQVLIDVGEFDKALDVFKFINNNFSDRVDGRVLFNEVRLFSFIGDYDNAKILFDQNKDKLIEFDPKIEIFDTFYNVVNGKRLNRISVAYRYLYNQMVDYKEDDFLYHVKRHLADYNKDIENPNPAVFNSDFPLSKVLDEIKKVIPNDKRTYFGFYNNFYVFKYDNVGRVSNKSTDYFRVVVFHNTNKLITMYPMQHGEMLPSIDLNYLNDNYNKPQVKQLSRVDKFYNKYGSFYKK